MNGKLAKVKQYNLEFGARDRFVNILGCFKYKPNGNVYIIYADTDTKYSIIYYGSGHLKESVALCMQCRNKTEEEIIKEYLFKLIQQDNLDNFELISLDSIENIEIIASDKIEVKPEILTSLIDIVMPKHEVKEEQLEVTPQKKKKSKNILLPVLIIIILIGGAYYLFLGIDPKDTTEKYITCTKNYQHNELIANVEEINKYNFDFNDKLQSVDSTIIYQFNEATYQDFIWKGTYYKYMPSSDAEGSWDKNDNEYIFKVMTKKRVDTSYSEPTDYEAVLSRYKANGYTCTESLVNE